MPRRAHRTVIRLGGMRRRANSILGKMETRRYGPSVMLGLNSGGCAIWRASRTCRRKPAPDGGRSSYRFLPILLREYLRLGIRFPHQSWPETQLHNSVEALASIAPSFQS